MLTLYVFFDRIFQVNLSGIKSEALRTELLSTKDLKNVLLEDGSQPYMGNMVSLRKFTKNFRQSEFISLQKNWSSLCWKCKICLKGYLHPAFVSWSDILRTCLTSTCTKFSLIGPILADDKWWYFGLELHNDLSYGVCK